MTDLLIRDVDPETHKKLQRRAEQAGISLQAYVSRLLEQHAAQPSLSEWLDRLTELPRHPELSGAETIRAVRDELP